MYVANFKNVFLFYTLGEKKEAVGLDGWVASWHPKSEEHKLFSNNVRDRWAFEVVMPLGYLLEQF